MKTGNDIQSDIIRTSARPCTRKVHYFPTVDKVNKLYWTFLKTLRCINIRGSFTALCLFTAMWARGSLLLFVDAKQLCIQDSSCKSIPITLPICFSQSRHFHFSRVYSQVQRLSRFDPISVSALAVAVITAIFQGTPLLKGLWDHLKARFSTSARTFTPRV
jgi:hypothetical protein